MLLKDPAIRYTDYQDVSRNIAQLRQTLRQSLAKRPDGSLSRAFNYVIKDELGSLNSKLTRLFKGPHSLDATDNFFKLDVSDLLAGLDACFRLEQESKGLSLIQVAAHNRYSEIMKTGNRLRKLVQSLIIKTKFEDPGDLIKTARENVQKVQNKSIKEKMKRHEERDRKDWQRSRLNIHRDKREITDQEWAAFLTSLPTENR